MKNFKKIFLSLLIIGLIFCVPKTNAYAKTYKANKVTAQQIVKEFQKKCPVKKVFAHKKSDMIEEDRPNRYKTKYGFYDKKYKKVYCTVEVFEDVYDAVSRKAYIDMLQETYSIFGFDESIPLQAHRYKNVILRTSQKMPLKYYLKYYNVLKKIVK